MESGISWFCNCTNVHEKYHAAYADNAWNSSSWRVEHCRCADVIEGTVSLLRTVRCDQSAMDEQINAAVTFLRKVSTEDPIQEFRRKHRRRQVPIRFDPNRTTPEIQMTQFYRMEFNKFLDLVITEYGDNLNSCLEKIKPLVIVLKPPVSIPAIDDIKALVEFFPRTIEIDPYVLHAEFSIFVAHVDALILQYPDRSFNTLAEIANYSEERKSVFPLTNKCYHLLLYTSFITLWEQIN